MMLDFVIIQIISWLRTIKGEQKKTRPHGTVPNVNFKVLYINKLFFFITPVYFLNKNLKLMRTYFLWTLKKIINYFAKKILFVCLKVPY